MCKEDIFIWNCCGAIDRTDTQLCEIARYHLEQENRGCEKTIACHWIHSRCEECKETLDGEAKSQQLWAEKEAKKALQRMERKIKTDEEAMRRMGHLDLEVDGKL